MGPAPGAAPARTLPPRASPSTALVASAPVVGYARGARDGAPANLDAVSRIAELGPPVQCGGGIRDAPQSTSNN